MEFLGIRVTRVVRRGRETVPCPNLLGDREIEHTWCAAQLWRLASPGHLVLDVGPGRSGALMRAAVRTGAKVIGVDLLPRGFELPGSSAEYIQRDILTASLPAEAFDLVVNCSSVEHIGLPGRFSAADVPDGDLRAMRRLHGLLRPTGLMILTLPLGRDAVFAPLHRVYGPQRLPLLLDGYVVLEEACWHKPQGNEYVLAPRERVWSEPASEHYYGIGLFLLSRQVNL